MKKLILLAVIALFSVSLKAQILTPVTWSYGSKRISKTEAIVFLKATIDDKWHIYSQFVKDGGPVKTTFTFPTDKTYSLIGKPTEPTPISKYEDAFKMQLTYFEKSVIFQQKVKLNSSKAIVKGTIEFMVCNDEQCLPPSEINFSIPVK
ncbi:protein-disulfide reductase DsbD domain-containing protein [Pedobacter sp.]|uniref:protein-disulfide reductase DsbD domain-containing protein n=1 Tax=Pedobacter sp. TaxID=1411316 RepID=UPI003D7FA5FE